MIDLHTHILPGLDDGARDLEMSVAMARTAVADGIRTVVATPDVNGGDGIEPVAMLFAVGALNVALVRADVPLAVMPGGLVAVTTAGRLDHRRLKTFSLGGGGALLVESPFVHDVPFLEEVLTDLDLRGFRPVLAHPERSPVFQTDVDRLARLVERGVSCAVDAGSLTGRFGSAARETAIRLFRHSLAHVVCSDAHDDKLRAPRLREAFDAVERDLPSLRAQARYFTVDAPSAILAGRPVPSPPSHESARRRRFRRLIRR